MNGFIWGALGVVFTVAVFCAGFFTGWKGNDFYRKKTAAAVKHELSEAEKRRIAEEEAAFSTLMNYSADMAYGIVKAPEPNGEEE